jgi:hypothetical protein
MSIRNLVVVTLGVALVSSSFATYTARLYFKNETTGLSNTGAVQVHAGDTVSFNFTFARDSGDTTSKWSLLEMFVDVDPAAVNLAIPDAQTNNASTGWDAMILASFKPASAFPIRTPWQPNDGIIHDNGVDPSDTTQPVITNRGVYALIGVSGANALAGSSTFLKFYTFTVGAAAPGTQVKWGNEGRMTDSGITTTLLDSKSVRSKITDNYLVMVPEPSTFAAIGMGLVSLLGLRRRK